MKVIKIESLFIILIQRLEGGAIMTKNSLRALFLVMMGVLLISCATPKALVPFEPCDFKKAGHFVQKVDNFMVILDASDSMDGSYMGYNKLYYAKEIMSRMNQTISDLKLTGALRTFGQGYCPWEKKTTLVYGLTEYSESGLEGAIGTVKWAGGNTPLALAIDAANEDLKSTQGDIAVIIVSDGEGMDNAPVQAAENMKTNYGDRLCIYTVLVGKGQALMEQIAQAGRCGFSVGAMDIASSKGMGDFVEKVFLERGIAIDSDGDGVFDDSDKCPNTPKGVKVDASGCPLDTDGDGVYDYLDQCPGTPKGAKVNEKGCWVLKGVQFDTGKSDIKPVSYPVLDEVVVVLAKNPTLKLEIQGHTDNVGSQASNQKLSENRAMAVMEYFVAKGINQERLSAAGYGFARPIASNETAEGRAENRRVELTPVP
jgi:OOP family OmpA-OmpF porin